MLAAIANFFKTILAIFAAYTAGREVQSVKDKVASAEKQVSDLKTADRIEHEVHEDTDLAGRARRNGLVRDKTK